ncbi:hypothetical protein JAAARDRAFT_38904 [Jaapia argillacea MUCL 33604]|uniref:Uncharacterized protein n=1 Tax=Jaapia argillacea MUCL 33604 TaxID=933084 RepID=A0A067PUD7_9AGAM|nr:hypothetical protein JAAARDRAFT_38904 [Jaapia argillacea MUCL 33604]
MTGRLDGSDRNPIRKSQKKGPSSANSIDPFAARQGTLRSGLQAILATALFRCWHIIAFFSAWATAIALISHNVKNLSIQPTLLTVIGTVLGFVISYRTTSSFERYNEGRRLWSQIVLGSRTFARTVWFHVPESQAIGGPGETDAEKKARVLIEKKTVVNLLEAYAISVKHYLRGEDGIYYVDLYHLVKFLPPYALPAGLPSQANLHASEDSDGSDTSNGKITEDVSADAPPALLHRVSTNQPDRDRKTSFAHPPVSPRSQAFAEAGADPEKALANLGDESYLLPARMPPKYHLFDLFPFSLLVKLLTKKGKDVKGRKAARLRAQLRSSESHNIPLEISLYLSSYIAALQNRKALDAPTTNALLAALNQLVDALTGLERILTTPIPFSYSIHLWVVTAVYCLLLPFQIWNTLKWLTIPATALLTFIFFGFLVAGEEIENPFGYDKNDLNMDHFTHNIIRNELRAITATPAPDPYRWAFAPSNDLAFALSQRWAKEPRVTPEEWVRRGTGQMQQALSLESRD